MDLWDECTIDIDYEEIKGLSNTAGLDLSASCDITAFVQLLMMRKIIDILFIHTFLLPMTE